MPIKEFCVALTTAEFERTVAFDQDEQGLWTTLYQEHY
jgi:hypothetical protein